MASSLRLITAAAATVVVAAALAVPQSADAAAPSHAYRANDYADGRAMSILSPGENGLVNATDLLQYGALQKRPAASDDQLGKYANLLYGYPKLTDKTLGSYFDDESFGVKSADVTRTEQPETGVTIYRDTHDVPHVYGTTDQTMAFGAGYAQAEDRLFLMDVLRHYGSGTLASFLGSSCEFEQMDHDQLLLAPYTPAQAKAQVDALPTEYGAQGTLARSLIYNYVAGVNHYIDQTRLDLSKLPADYAAAAPDLLPQKWTVADVVAIAGLIGGIFGKGGGAEIDNAHLLQYLRGKLGTTAGSAAYHNLKRSNDPLAPTTSAKTFPYEQPGKINTATTALPDAGKATTGGPVATSGSCTSAASAPSTSSSSATEAMSIVQGLQQLPKHMSNALVVDANHSADGHPVAVFGPQVSYYAPQILSELDLHSPGYAAEGASFPGTGLVELGRGEDYAWSATSAGSDLIDQRLEKICKPGGGTPAAHGAYYEYKGKCLAMTVEHFTETALPKVGGVGTPATLDHVIYKTRHGIVQGWTTAGGKPVAVVTQRSTYNHDIDSVVGFLGFGQPARTHDVKSWMAQAAKISFTFNWFYVDDRDTGYFVSGLDPVRPSDVDPTLPTWGTGNAEWTGYLPASKHVHDIDPKRGYFISWNNKPALGFSAADDQYGHGQVFRSVLLVKQLDAQLAAHHGKVTRAQVVQAMETAATQDLDGVTVLPLLLKYVGSRTEPAGVRAMLSQLRAWIAAGAHRRKAATADTQYQHAAGVAIADEVEVDLIRALFDPLLVAGGVGSAGSNGGATAPSYSVLPMQFVNTPNSGGAHLGSAYDGGYEGYLVTAFQQLLGGKPADAFTPALTARLCGSGTASCRTAIDKALAGAYSALVAANGSSDVATWTSFTDSKAAGQTMPVYDAIHFRALGVVGQPAIDWQNRPTFQQVINFLRHRTR